MKQEKQPDLCKLIPNKPALKISVETPNSTSALPINPSFPKSHPSKKTTEKIIQITPKYHNNCEEITKFVGVAQAKLKMQISINDLKTSLETRILNLQIQQDENDRLQFKYQEVETAIVRQRCENVKIKKDIDVYTNKIYQDDLEVQQLDTFEEILESRNWESPANNIRKHETTAEDELISGGNECSKSLHPDSVKRSKMPSSSARNDRFSHSSKAFQREHTSHKQRNPKQAGDVRGRISHHDSHQVILNLNQEIKKLEEPDQIVLKLQESIEFFQFKVVEKVLEQKRQNLSSFKSNPQQQEAKSLTRNFDFESIRETGANDGKTINQPLVGTKLNPGFDTHRPSIRRMFGNHTGPQNRKSYHRISGLELEEHLDVYKNTTRKDRPNFSSFGFAESRPSVSVHKNFTKKDVPVKVSERQSQFKPRSDLTFVCNKAQTLTTKILSSDRNFPYPRIETPFDETCINLYKNVPEDKKPLCYKQFQKIELKSNKKAFETSASNVRKIHPYEEKMAEKSFKFQKNSILISKKFKEFKVNSSRGIVESLKQKLTRKTDRKSIGEVDFSIQQIRNLIKQTSLGTGVYNLLKHQTYVKSSSLDK